MFGWTSVTETRGARSCLSTDYRRGWIAGNRFEPISNGRYVVPTLIVVQAAAAVTIVHWSALLAQRRGRAPLLAVAAGGLAGLVLVVQPLFELARYYDSRPADNRALIDAFATFFLGAAAPDREWLHHDVANLAPRVE